REVAERERVGRAAAVERDADGAHRPFEAEVRQRDIRRQQDHGERHGKRGDLLEAHGELREIDRDDHQDDRHGGGDAGEDGLQPAHRRKGPGWNVMRARARGAAATRLLPSRPKSAVQAAKSRGRGVASRHCAVSSSASTLLLTRGRSASIRAAREGWTAGGALECGAGTRLTVCGPRGGAGLLWVASSSASTLLLTRGAMRGPARPGGAAMVGPPEPATLRTCAAPTTSIWISDPVERIT